MKPIRVNTDQSRSRRDETFLDSNILIYLLSSDVEKADRAEIVLSERSVISVQVLNEFAAVARGKYRLDWNLIGRQLDAFRARFRVEPLTVSVQAHAVGLARRYGFRIYDANIVAAALAAGCSTLYSEDMQDGMRIEGLTIRNPSAQA